MKRWTAVRMSRPCGVYPEASAPAKTTSAMMVQRMRPRRGVLARATEVMRRRRRERPRLADTIVLPEGRLKGRPLPGSFLYGPQPPAPGDPGQSPAADDVTVPHYGFAAKRPITRHSALSRGRPRCRCATAGRAAAGWGRWPVPPLAVAAARRSRRWLGRWPLAGALAGALAAGWGVGRWRGAGWGVGRWRGRWLGRWPLAGALAGAVGRWRGRWLGRWPRLPLAAAVGRNRH